MLPNPYTPGQTPHHLAGREEEQQAIRDYLAPVLAYGHMAGPQLVVTGPRGIGKTSLLDSAKEEALRHGFVTAWTSCHRGQPLLADLTHSITRSLRGADALPAPGRWNTALEKVGIHIGVSALGTLGVDISGGRRDPATPPTGAISAIEDMLHLAAHAARREVTGGSGVGLFVVIDELHAGAPDELAILLNAIQNLTHDRQNNPLALVSAGIPSVGGILTAAATFGERSRWLRLPELTSAELADALTGPARELDVTWEPAALTLAIQAAQNYPHFVQIIGSATWNSARPSPHSTISLADAQTGIRIGQTEIASLYAARWASVTEAERALLNVMAHAPAARDGSVARRDIEQTWGKDISTHRARLMDKAIIEDTERGYLRFTLPGFTDYIRDQLQANGQRR